MSDENDPPIEEQEFLGGVKVVNIGDVRVSRGFSRRHHSSCPHANMVYDGQERRIWCKDCEKDVEAFDAFKHLVEYYSAAIDGLNRRDKKLIEAEEYQIHSLAAKMIDTAWRKRAMVPACPHCHHGLFPEDFKNKPGMLGRDYANKRRAAIGKAEIANVRLVDQVDPT